MAEPVLALYAYMMEDYRCVNEPFIAARKAYFADPTANNGCQRMLSENGMTTVIKFQFRPHRFHWSVRCGKNELQRTCREKDDTYSVQTFSENGMLFRKDCFSEEHQLLRVTYYTGAMLRGELVLQPDGQIDTSFLVTEETVFRRERVRPCPFVPYGQEAFHRYTKVLGIPPVIAYTPHGVVCYYPEELAARAEQIYAANPVSDGIPMHAVLTGKIGSDGQTLHSKADIAEQLDPHKWADVVNKKYYASGKIQNGKTGANATVDAASPAKQDAPSTLHTANDGAAPAGANDGERLVLAPQAAETMESAALAAERVQPTAPNFLSLLDAGHNALSAAGKDAAPCIPAPAQSVKTDEIPELPTASELFAELCDSADAQPAATPGADAPGMDALQNDIPPADGQPADAQPAATPCADAPGMDALQSIDLQTPQGGWRLEYTAGQQLDYVGETQDGERSGFGVCADVAAHTAFAGTWLYNGRCGLKTHVTERGAVYAQFEDTANESSDECTGLVFDGDGSLLYSGTMKQETRTGFGMALRSDGTHYVGQWKNDQPNGSGVLLSAEGELRYQGQWVGGARSGLGTEYRDGQPRYTGSWRNNHWDGAGEYFPDKGGRIAGTFTDGLVSGSACEYAPNGEKCYEGEWAANAYHGHGVLQLPGGGTLEGTFVNGVVSGEADERNAAGQLLYRGTYKNGQRSGSGSLYRNGELIYEGEFLNGVPSVRGKYYENGDLIYAGQLRDGQRCGVGASLQQGQPVYFGEWAEDEPNGYGLLYAGGAPAFAGSFAHGQKNGRVNAYRDGKLSRELICRDDTPEYMVEYGSDGSPVYAGAVFGGKRSGLGRLLNEYCECIQQGVFCDGVFQRPAQVIPRRLEPLTCPPALRGTPYEETACPQETYLLGLPVNGGIYSGHTRGGVPNGRGTIAYADHLYSGLFADGLPFGEGTLCLSSGETVAGVFGECPDAEAIRTGGHTYYVIRSAPKPAPAPVGAD